jgi:anti-anti-sigma factor
MDADPTSPFDPYQARPGLDISVERINTNTVRVCVAGELDLSTSAALDRELDDLIADGARTSIVLDLGKVSFLDSTGLRSLWTARQHALSTGGMLVLDEPSEPVLRVLRTTRLDKVFHVRSTDAGPGDEARSVTAEPTAAS